MNHVNASDSLCAYEREKHLALDQKAFDQSLPDGGWRKVGNIPGCEIAAASLIADYRVRHPEATSTLAWHQGQLLATAGLHDQAITELANARLDSSQDIAGWNHYVDATIAFLAGDRQALEQAHEQLAKVVYNPASDLPAPEDGYIEWPTDPGQPTIRMRWPLNIDVVEGLVNCCGRSYREAYSSECRQGAK
jgi:hypothetical protein